MFCLPITILLNHLTAALVPKALLNKPLPCKAGRYREPRDVDNPVLCCSCGTAACLQGVHRQGKDEGFGSTGARTCFCLSVVDAAGFGLGCVTVPLQGHQSPPTVLHCSAWGTWGSVDVADLVRVLTHLL